MGLLEETRKRFGSDHFATEAAQVEIIGVEEGWAKCQMTLRPVHLNANGGVMGGAVFTLADFAFAVASNTGSTHTVTVDSHMSFLNAVKGKVLYAETFCEKAGRRMCTYRVVITDDLGTNIAVAIISGMRL